MSSDALLIGQGMAALVENGCPVEIYPLADPPPPAEESLYRGRVHAVHRETESTVLSLGDGLEALLPFRHCRGTPKEGELVLVQISQPARPQQNKRAVATAKPVLVGRTIVVQLHQPGLTFSKRANWGEKEKPMREALRRLAKDYGIAVRTVAGEAAPEYIRREAQNLLSRYQESIPGVDNSVECLDPAPSPVIRLVRDHTPPTGNILIEDPALFAEVRKMVKSRWPWLEERLQRWKEQELLFEAFGVAEAMERALTQNIPLPSGGWIRIETTEALTAIDVNSGNAGTGRDAATMRLGVNREAAGEIARQLRLHNIGGLIVVDFLDMKTKKDRARVLQVFDQVAARDARPLERSGFSKFGLLEIRRKRSGRSLREWRKS